MKRFLLLACSLYALALPLRAENGAPLHKTEVLSKVYTIDKIYKSMEGPQDQQSVILGDSEHPELLWVKSVRVDIVGEDGKTPAPSEFMCHMNLDVDPARHQKLFGETFSPSPRLLTLSQGVFEGTLPEGYGYPLVSNEPLTVYTQVLNHNIANPKNLKVRHLVTISYLRDAELKTPMKALVNIGASGMVRLDDQPANLLASMPSMPGMSMPAAGSSSSVASSSPVGIHHDGDSCLMAPRAPNAGMNADYVDPQGHKLTGHWVVPPGKQVNASDITWFMNLPYDTKIHFALAHLHPYAQSLTLRDTTTGKDLWIASATGPKKGIGLAHVDSFDSEPGVPMYRDHKYELISVYNNTTRKNADSMASMYFGMEDPMFHRPDAVTLASREADAFDTSNIVVIRTGSGDLALQLNRDQAPQTVNQFFRLIRAGAFAHARFAKIDPERGIRVTTGQLSPELEQLASAPPEATAAKHTPGMVSYCPGDPGFSIVLMATPKLDGLCTVFGQLGPGAGVIRTMVGSPRGVDGTLKTPVDITKIEPVGQADYANTPLAPPKVVADSR